MRRERVVKRWRNPDQRAAVVWLHGPVAPRHVISPRLREPAGVLQESAQTQEGVQLTEPGILEVGGDHRGDEVASCLETSELEFHKYFAGKAGRDRHPDASDCFLMAVSAVLELLP